MGFIILGHGKDRNLGDRAFFPLDTTGSLVYGREICIEISRVPPTPGNLLPGRRDFPQCLAIVGHVSQNYENMHVLFEGEEFGGRQRHSGGSNPFQGRVVGQVEKEDSPIDGPRLSKLRGKIVCLLEGNPHRSKNHGEFLFLAENPGLSRNLSSKLIVRKSRA